ncbi:glycosyltransferase [Streptosporangium vulgare]|uniref:glycosyltransferase n=1 Tax=Streptosporangium vulgare TaxID=46190 RepID=UPI0031E2DF8B
MVHVPAGPAMTLSKDDLLPWIPDFGRWLARRWSAAPPDMVHSHFWMSGLAALAAARDAAVPHRAHLPQPLGTVKRRPPRPGPTPARPNAQIEAMVASQVDAVVATCADEVAELRGMRVHGAGRGRSCGVGRTLLHPSGRRGTSRRVSVLLAIAVRVRRKGVTPRSHALARIPGATLVVGRRRPRTTRRRAGSRASPPGPRGRPRQVPRRCGQGESSPT